MYPGTHADADPTKAATIMATSGETVTYRELDERSTQLARHWRAVGLGPGDHVAILAENNPWYHVVYWAALRSGLYLTAVNRHLTVEEAAYIVADSGARSLVTTGTMAETALGVVERVPGCTDRLALDGPVDGFDDYHVAVGQHPVDRLADQPLGATMLYSSGTTGHPKGIKRPPAEVQVDDELRAIATMGSALLGMDAETVYLSPAPLYHSAPMAWTGAIHELGGTVVVMERFEPVEFLAAIERWSVTHTQCVPTMFVRLLKLPQSARAGRDLSSLRSVLHAAAPCPVEVKRQMIDWLGPILSEYYAGTEGNGVTFIDSEQWLEHPGSVGRAILGIPHVCDDEGNELPTGQAGTIYFEQPSMPFEYHGDPAKTRQAQHPDHPHWSSLGDIGYLDEEGYLYLTDRKAFMIISGGVNIYPQEVEDALVLHPKVADVAVFGLPDPEMGEFVQAVVQPADGVAADDGLAEELRSYLREHLAPFKIPRVIDFRPELPRLPTGKLYKRHLRDEYLSSQVS